MLYNVFCLLSPTLPPSHSPASHPQPFLIFPPSLHVPHPAFPCLPPLASSSWSFFTLCHSQGPLHLLPNLPLERSSVKAIFNHRPLLVPLIRSKNSLVKDTNGKEAEWLRVGLGNAGEWEVKHSMEMEVRRGGATVNWYSTLQYCS